MKVLLLTNDVSHVSVTCNLWRSTKSLSRKHIEVPESNKAWTLILLESIFTISGIVKQGEALNIRIGPLIKDCAAFFSRTVPTMAGHLCFPIQHLPLLIEYSLNTSNVIWFRGWSIYRTISSLAIISATIQIEVFFVSLLFLLLQ
jgi:hypothetical protein